LRGFFHIFIPIFRGSLRCLTMNQHGICQDLNDASRYPLDQARSREVSEQHDGRAVIRERAAGDGSDGLIDTRVNHRCGLCGTVIETVSRVPIAGNAARRKASRCPPTRCCVGCVANGSGIFSGSSTRRSNQSRIPFPRRKRMATPISDMPMSNNASESEMDFPAAKTPTITPAIENIHKIMRSPPM